MTSSELNEIYIYKTNRVFQSAQKKKNCSGSVNEGTTLYHHFSLDIRHYVILLIGKQPIVLCHHRHQANL